MITPKNILVTIIIILAVTLFFFLYVNSEDGSFRENGIVEIKTNLQLKIKSNSKHWKTVHFMQEI